MKTLRLLLIIAAIAVAGLFAFIYAGVYPMGADVPHNALTYWALETLRERSIARAAAEIEVPELNDPDLLLAGGPDYNEMCAGCHLKPGKARSDFTVGLYPTPPNLAVTGRRSPDDLQAMARRQFWIIKHGIKASGMPAWGPTHDDGRIWAMVAFLQRLPDLTADQYQILTARAAGDEHSH